MIPQVANQAAAPADTPVPMKAPTFREQIAGMRKSQEEEAQNLALYEARIRDLGLMDKPCNYLTLWDLSKG